MDGRFPRRGEIWQIQFPDETKHRPGLIISVNSRNQFAHSVLAIPITSNLTPSPAHVLLATGQGGLRHTSMARCENINHVRKDRISRGSFTGTIEPLLMREIERALMTAVGIPVD